MEKNDSLFLQMYKIQHGKDFSSKDSVLLMEKDVTKTNEPKCPFCQSILSEGHTKDCMMYEYPEISIWWFLLPIMLMFVFGYAWLKWKINEYKKKK